MNNRSWVVVVVVAVVVGAGSFYGGMRYGESRPPSAEAAMETLGNLTPEEAIQAFQSGGGLGPAGPQGFLGGNGPALRRGAGGGFINGDIASTDAESITVQMPDGSTQIVFYSDSTAIAKSTEGSASDLAAGTGVTVTGTANSDGSITAERIQIRAPGEDLRAFPAPPPTAAP
jgi:hypothetical protein